jgi:hypothetical protein
MVPCDNEALTNMLHVNGVNMRYLGALARLAREEEQADEDLYKEQKQRIQAMPLYWLELLEIEILARSVKHELAALFKAQPEARKYPAQTITTLLNHIFGADPKVANATTAAAATSNSTATSTTPSITTSASASSIHSQANSGSSKGSKKKKGKASSKTVIPGASAACQSSLPPLPDATGSREEVIASLQAIAAAKFCYSDFTLFNFVKKIAGEEEDADAKSNIEAIATATIENALGGSDDGAVVPENDENKAKDSNKKADHGKKNKGTTNGKKEEKSKDFKDTKEEAKAKAIAAITAAFAAAKSRLVGPRITPIVLVRRICQITGLRIVTKKYDFLTAATPFAVSDIIAVVPLVRLLN